MLHVTHMHTHQERTALIIAFTLRSSTYATMCIRELLKEHSEEAALGLRNTGEIAGVAGETDAAGETGVAGKTGAAGETALET